MTEQPTRAAPVRPVKVTVIIIGTDGETTTYRMNVEAAQEERTKQFRGGHQDVRFTLSDVEYDDGDGVA